MLNAQKPNLKKWINCIMKIAKPLWELSLDLKI